MVSVKRKSTRVSSSDTSKGGKKVKSSSESTQEKSSKPQTLLTIEKIRSYQKDIIESPKHYNNIAILLSQYKIIIEAYSSESTQENNVDDLFPVSRALTLSLYKIFETLIKKSQLRFHKNLPDQKKVIVKWLQTKYSDFKNNLFNIFSVIGNETNIEELESFKADNLDILMKCLYIESEFMAPNENEPFFATQTFKQILESILFYGSVDDINKIDGSIENFLTLEFYESYFQRFWDIKYYFFVELKNIFDNATERSVSEKRVLYSNVLLVVKPAAVFDQKNFEKIISKNYVPQPPVKAISNLNQFKQNFERCWLSLIGFKLLPEQTKSILLILHKRVIPFFNNPTKLMDFLTESYDLGFENNDVSISILALNGLYELMKSHNLEYPDFFTKLYGILTPDLLHLNYRNRFFRLLDVFMSSTHLPSSIVASIIKRLSKLSLTAPPSGIVIVIPFIYNLLKKHPTCMLLLHTTASPLEDADYIDPFDNTETDPAKTNAMESSIWELESMIQHYHPNVSSLAKIFTQPFNKYSYNMEDFLDWSYSKLIASETNKRFKGDLSIEFEKWDTLLGSNDAEDDNKTSYLTGYEF